MICVWGSEGVGCVRDSATVSKGSRLDDADGNPVLLVRQRHGGGQLAWRVLWWLIDTDTCGQCGSLAGELYPRHEKRTKNPAETTGNRYKIVILMGRTR